MLTTDELLARQSSHQTGPAYRMDEIQAQLELLPAWHYADACIQRRYQFTDYYKTLAFVNALADVIHREDHHPELRVTYNTCTVSFNTHSVNGISINDFICAAKADAVFDPSFGTS